MNPPFKYYALDSRYTLCLMPNKGYFITYKSPSQTYPCTVNNNTIPREIQTLIDKKLAELL